MQHRSQHDRMHDYGQNNNPRTLGLQLDLLRCICSDRAASLSGGPGSQTSLAHQRGEQNTARRVTANYCRLTCKHHEN